VLFVTPPGWQFSLNNACVGSRVLQLRTSVLKMEAVCSPKCRHASIKVQDLVTQHTFPNLLCPFLGSEFNEEIVHRTGDSYQPCGVSAHRLLSLNDSEPQFYAYENGLDSDIRFQDRKEQHLIRYLAGYCSVHVRRRHATTRGVQNSASRSQ